MVKFICTYRFVALLTVMKKAGYAKLLVWLYPKFQRGRSGGTPVSSTPSLPRPLFPTVSLGSKKSIHLVVSV